MNGNRLTPIYAPHIQGLDYYGRRREAPSGSRSGSGTGAEFFDFISSPAANLAVSMGSFCLENLLRGAGAQADARPALLVQALNRAVCGEPEDNCYATLFHASVDPLRRQMCYVNAGHEPALLLRKRQNRAIIMERTGAILGLTHRSTYGQRTIPLEPGDLLAVFSDGVGEMIGAAGVLSVLRRSPCAHAADLVEEILMGCGAPATNQTAAVVRFTGTAEAISTETEAELSFAAA